MKSHRRVRLKTGSADRRGSTLIIVLALLGMLLILGMLVLTVASQEEVNAEYFADAAKVPGGDLGPDVYFDFALRQMIIGPDVQWERQSALWGGQASFMANLFGRDNHPHNGGGINLIWDNSAAFAVVDMDDDGVADNPELKSTNWSPAAQGGLTDLANYPNPDVDYLYPDINNCFISYDGLAPGSGAPLRVIIPSYLRPQLLRGIEDSMAAPIPVSDWYANKDTMTHVLRPHKWHRAVDDAGNVLAEPDPTDNTTFHRARFVSDLFPDIDPDGSTPAVQLSSFPFPTHQMGVWTGDGNTNQFDADPDGDGVLDAIWLDLGFPAQQTGTNEWYVPLFAVKVVELDSLFNANTHGSLAGNVGTLGGPRFGGFKYDLVDGAPGDLNVDDNGNGVVDDEGEVGLGNDTASATEFLHRSHLGASPHEVNPQWALHASVGSAAALKPHRIFFGHDPVDAIEQANMEFWFLLMGRADFDTIRASSDITAIYPGRWGEVGRLTSAIDSMIAYEFPLPGNSFPANPASFNPANGSHLAYDDNLNSREGGPFADAQSKVFPSGIVFPGQGQPTDYHGGQRTVQSGSFGRTRLLSRSNSHPHRWPRYDLGVVAPGTGWQTLNAVHSGALLPGAAFLYLIDEPEETKIEPTLAQNDPYDTIYGADETASLHLSNNDKSSLNLYGRLDKLLPINFQEATNAESIRRLFTTVSWDLRSSGKAYYGAFGAGTPDRFRKWEYQVDPQFGRELFPPVYDVARPPFRRELRDLLTHDPNDPQSLKKPQARLSVNHVLDRGLDGRLRFRPLTPHPTGLSNAVVRTVSSRPSRPEQIQTAADQEWLARRDRQLLCRDIYCLLYTLGGGNDSVNYLLSGVYSSDPNDAQGRGDQCARMAQFAVNLVDQMDPDDVMTAFEYDTNLSDGWGLDDDPFTSGVATDPHDFATNSQRGVVYGVEQQQLALTEALIVWANQVKSGGAAFNHDATEWDDTSAHNWVMVELENLGPRSVDLGSQAWQIAVKPVMLGVYATDPDTGGPVDPIDGADGMPLIGEERRVTFQSGTVDAGQNSMLSVFTDNEADVDGTVLRQSRFVVNPHKGHADTMIDTGAKYALAPRALMGQSDQPRVLAAQGLELDLITNFVSGTNQTYRINKGTNGDGDGDRVNGSASDPPGKDLLSIVSTSGAQDAIDGMTPAMIPVVIELRRRVNPLRQSPDPDPATSSNHAAQSRDNPWVVVDRIRVSLLRFDIQDTANYTEIRPQLQALTSRERGEPLNRGSETTFALNGGLHSGMDDWRAYVWNSVGARNLQGAITPPPVHNLWQPHYDRDFQTLVDLFEVPLYGPDEVTRLTAFNSSNVEPVFATNWAGNMTAGYKFLHPGSTVAALSADHHNRWHRVLEFLTVPDRWHRHSNSPPFVIDAGGVGVSPIGIYRVPGRLNLNMIRSPEHLAGLIDDREICEFNVAGSPWLVDPVEGGRDWWVQFLLARDGLDPRGSGYVLPGVPAYYGEDANRNGVLESGEDTQTVNGALDPRPRQGSRPFRTLQYSASGVGSLQDTVFRGLPLDQQSGAASPRGLFEVGTLAEHNSGSVDASVRHRILGKVANNATVRSNAFAVFIQVDFFEAREIDVSGQKVYRVGAMRADSPGHRGIFIVDRSKAFDLLSSQDLPTTFDDGGTPKFNFSFNQSFNFRSLILHRQTIR